MKRFFFFLCLGVSGFAFSAAGPVSPQVCMDATGNIVAIWAQTSSQGNIVSSVSRPKNGSWGSPQILSSESGDSFSPQIAINATGHLLSIWKSYVLSPSPAHLIRVAEADFGGPWGAATTVFSTTNTLLSPTVKINASGDALALWRALDTSKGLFLMQSSSLFSPETSWSSPQTLATNQLFSYPDVALDDQGVSATVWTENNQAMNAILLSIGSSGSWEEKDVLSDVTANQGNPKPHVVLNNAMSGSRGAAVWSGSKDDQLFIQMRFFLGGDLWSDIVNISEEGPLVAQPVIAVSDQGHVVVVWQETSDRTHWIIQGVFYDPVEGWGTVQTLSSSSAQNPRVVMNTSGDAVVGWELGSAGHSVIQVASVSSSGVWSSAQTISEEGENSQNVEIAMNDLSDAVAVWLANSGSEGEIKGSVSVGGGDWSAPETLSN